MFNSLFGKYRFLVVSIAFFLVFDLGVLVLNFYTSGKIAEQAERINLAGRQRTLTQQMSKATLYIKAQKLQQWVYQSGLDELREHFNTFGKTLDVFNDGGTLESADTGRPIHFDAVSSDDGRAILLKANLLWEQFEAAINPLMVDTLITDDEIRPASLFIANNNEQMFRHMDELTQYFADSAERQTSLLRQAQVIGISLATVNFFIILFHFLGQLRGRDKEIQIKQHESDQILGTISEAVFLLDENLVMSGQHSKQLEEIFATERVAGRRFDRFLVRYFSKNTVETALNFVQLFHRKHIDPELIADVNPLKRVEAAISLESGETVKKYLDFSFAKLDQGDGQTSILVSVKDVTASILLEAQDQENANELEQKMGLLTQILPMPAQDLEAFVEESAAGYDRINALLKDSKNVKDNYEKILSRIARETHKLKGNALALNFEWVADKHHLFEETIDRLKVKSRRADLNGQDLLPLTMQLKAHYDDLEMVSELREKLASYGGDRRLAKIASGDESISSIGRVEENSKWYALSDFVKRSAESQGLAVDLMLRGFTKPVAPQLNEILYPVAVQLVRNSIAHGIESKATRENLKKPNHGRISVSLSNDKRGNYRFLFEDDGRGFDFDGIRAELVSKSVLTKKQAKTLGKTALIRCAFKDAISTSKETDQLSGRGVGLPLVWQQVKQLEGNLKIRSVENEFTQFIIDFTLSDYGDDPVVTQKAS